MVNDMSLYIDNGSGPIQNPELTQEEFDAGLIQMKESNVAALWQAAHDYELAEISGTAVGLLTLGTIKGGPIAIAIQVWCQSIWLLYYQRKPLITHEWNPELLDFSSCGKIPYTIPELLTEVYLPNNNIL